MPTLAEVERRLLAFQRRYQQTATPFDCPSPVLTWTGCHGGWTKPSKLPTSGMTTTAAGWAC